MTRQELRNFVARYSRRLDRALPGRGGRDPQASAAGEAGGLPGSLRMQSGRGAVGGLGVSGSEKLSPDRQRELYESRSKTVSPEYRRQVERYYRAISAPDPTTAPAW